MTDKIIEREPIDNFQSAARVSIACLQNPAATQESKEIAKRNLLFIAEQADDATKSFSALQGILSQALNEGDGVYRP